MRSGRRRGLAWALAATLAALPAGAAEVTGRITVDASGAEILPGGRISVPLEQVRVHIGVLERLGEIDALYAHVASTYTDDDGEYTFQLPDDPPEVPTTTLPHVLVVVLESEDLAVAVYDDENDPAAVACLGTNVVMIPNRGSIQVDVDLTARTDNDSAYQARAVDFRPTEDELASPVFDTQPRCADDVLGAAVFPTPAYDQRGLTNTKPDRFAHLAIHYARVFDAYEYLRDGLDEGGFEPVRVNAWDGFPDLGYLCSDHAILMPPGSSAFFGPDQESAVYALRHEYGHHFMCASPIAGADSLPPLATGDENHAGIANASSADAWAEGFAIWFAAAVAEHAGEEHPHRQRTPTGELDLRNGGAHLDDPFTAGEQRNYGWLGEEFAIATLLWQVSEAAGTRLVIDAIEGASVALDDFERVHTALATDSSIAPFFDTHPCSFPATGAFVVGIDCLFIDRGFYHDIDGDGLYGPDEIAGDNEVVGFTRWPLVARDATVFRPNTPEIEGSRLRLTVEDGAGEPVPVASFRVEVEYDPPLDGESSAYFETGFGDEPYEFAILVPGAPSRARITPVTIGTETAEPLVIESAFFHERIDPYREGGVAPVLLEHTFVVAAPEPAASALGTMMIAAVAALYARVRLRERAVGSDHT